MCGMFTTIQKVNEAHMSLLYQLHYIYTHLHIHVYMYNKADMHVDGDII